MNSTHIFLITYRCFFVALFFQIFSLRKPPPLPIFRLIEIWLKVCYFSAAMVLLFFPVVPPIFFLSPPHPLRFVFLCFLYRFFYYLFFCSLECSPFSIHCQIYFLLPTCFLRSPHPSPILKHSNSIVRFKKVLPGYGRIPICGAPPTF